MKNKKLITSYSTRKLTLLVIILLIFSNGFAQESTLPKVWDLQTCINYALENNITIKSAQADKKSSEVDKKTAQAAMFPTVSGSIEQNLSNYPFYQSSASSSSSTYVTSSSRTTIAGSYAVNANWTLFDGGIRSKYIQQTNLLDTIAQLNIENSKNNIKLSIIQDYLQILYANEAIKVYQSAVELSRAQLESNKIKLEVGAVSKSDVSQWEAQNATDKYDLINAQISLDNYKLQLKQLLELQTVGDIYFDLQTPTEEDVLALIPEEQTIFETAMDIMPQVKSGKLNTKYNDIAIDKAKSSYLPTVSLNAGISTNNRYNDSDYTIPTQLKNNLYDAIGLSVSIPIYSNREKISAVEKAQINREISQLSEQSTQKELFASVETAYRNVINSQAQYNAALEKVKSSQASYDVLNEQFKLGLKNTIELLTGKNTLISSEQELLQVKYTVLMNKKIIDYYLGKI